MHYAQAVIDFFTSVRVELSKVVWPTPNLTIKLTLIVVVVTIIVGFFVGGVDFLLTQAVALLLKNK